MIELILYNFSKFLVSLVLEKVFSTCQQAEQSHQRNSLSYLHCKVPWKEFEK